MAALDYATLTGMDQSQMMSYLGQQGYGNIGAITGQEYAIPGSGGEGDPGDKGYRYSAAGMPDLLGKIISHGGNGGPFEAILSTDPSNSDRSILGQYDVGGNLTGARMYDNGMSAGPNWGAMLAMTGGFAAPAVLGAGGLLEGPSVMNPSWDVLPEAVGGGGGAPATLGGGGGIGSTFGDLTGAPSLTGGGLSSGLPVADTFGVGSEASSGLGLSDIFKGLTTAKGLQGWGSLLAGGLGLLQGGKLRGMSGETDPWGTSGGRAASGQQLMSLLHDPSSITKVPGYESGLQAVERAGGAQGFQGSGKMATDIANYGGNFYNQYVQNLMGLAGAGARTSATSPYDATMRANTTLGNSLDLLVRGFGSIWGS